MSSKKKKTTVGVKGNQVGGGGESVADSLGSRSDLVLTSSEQDKSEHDRSGDSMPRGRRERSGPPRFHRGLYHCCSWLIYCQLALLRTKLGS